MMKMAMVMMMVVMMMMVVVSVEGQSGGVPDCASKLTPCLDYINGTIPPSTGCCDSIKEAVETQLPCLCNLYTTPGLLQLFNVTIPEALNLTKSCSVPVTLDRCSNSSAKSPTQSPPGRVPGGDNGSSGRTTAITALFITFFLSTLFY